MPLSLFQAIAAFALRSLLEGPPLCLPRGNRDGAFEAGLRMLALRRLVGESGDGLFAAAATEQPLPAY